jgi:hypothetical protein
MERNKSVYVGEVIDQTWRDHFVLHVVNNIFSSSTEDVGVRLTSDLVADASNLDHNLFFEGGDGVTIYWGQSNRNTYSITNDFIAFVGGSNNLVGDPLYVNSAVNNFQIADDGDSPAFDSGETNARSAAVYDVFQERYGLDIKVDFIGTRRPVGSEWDMGAYEARAGALLAAPNPPVLRIE